MGALPKRKISTYRKGKRRQDIKRKFLVKAVSEKSQHERLTKNRIA